MTQALSALIHSPEFAEGEAWQRRSVPAHSTVLKEGEVTREVFLVLGGTVRVIGEVELDGERKLRPGYCDLGPGSIFGEMCLFDLQPRSGSVVATEVCELAVIPGDRLRDHLDTHPEIGYAVLKGMMETLAARLRTANKRVSSLLAWGMKAHGIDEHL